MTLSPAVTFLPDCHRYTYESQEIEVVLDRLVEDSRDGLKAEIRVTTSRGTAGPGLLHAGRFNVGTARSRREVAIILEKRAGEALADVDFTGMLEQVCYKSIERWRQGEPTIALGDVDPADRPRQFHDVVTHGGTIFQADGGTGKSVLAAGVGVSVASGKPVVGRPLAQRCSVLYLDWEADQYVTAERVQAICRGSGIEEVPPIHYRRQVATLSESVSEVRKEITRLNVGFVIVDSIGMARSGDSWGPDATMSMFRALRSLGVPWLGIDHVSKGAKDTSRAYGTTYTHNLARLTWGIERAQDEDSDEVAIALINHKNNYGRRLSRRAYKLRFENEGEHLHSVEIRPCDFRDVAEFAAKLPVKERILAVVRSGKRPAAAIAEEIDIPADQVRARLAELSKAGKVRKVGDDWGLAG